MSGRGHVAWWIFGGLLVLQAAICLAVVASGATLIDYAAYELAAQRIARGVDPYADPALIQATFERFRDVLMTGDDSILTDAEEPAYIYPPTLASWMAATGLAGTPWLQAGWVLICAASIAVVAVIAVRDGASPWWALLAVLSLDTVVPLATGNAELTMTALGLVGCWLLWRGEGLAAAVPIALAVLIKPVSGPLFAAFSLLLIRQAHDRRAAATTVATAAVVSLLLVGLEAARWPGWLREDMLDWLGNAFEHTFMTLPVERQMPYSGWNRAPTQVFVTLGLPVQAAQFAALGLALAVLAAALVIVPRGAGFLPVFAVAYVIALVARPTIWTLLYLDLFLLLALWPCLASGWPRRSALALALTLAASHWAALLWTLAGGPPRFGTFQTDTLPLETLTVLPLAALAALWALRRPVGQFAR